MKEILPIQRKDKRQVLGLILDLFVGPFIGYGVFLLLLFLDNNFIFRIDFFYRVLFSDLPLIVLGWGDYLYFRHQRKKSSTALRIFFGLAIVLLIGDIVFEAVIHDEFIFLFLIPWITWVEAFVAFGRRWWRRKKESQIPIEKD